MNARLYDEQGRLFRIAIANKGWDPKTSEPVGKCGVAAWQADFGGAIQPCDLERFARELIMLLTEHDLTQAQLKELYGDPN